MISSRTKSEAPAHLELKADQEGNTELLTIGLEQTTRVRQTNTTTTTETERTEKAIEWKSSAVFQIIFGNIENSIIINI